MKDREDNRPVKGVLGRGKEAVWLKKKKVAVPLAVFGMNKQRLDVWDADG